MTLKRRIEELEGTFGSKLTAEQLDGALLWMLAQITRPSLFSEAQRAALDSNAAYRRKCERVASSKREREKLSDAKKQEHDRAIASFVEFLTPDQRKCAFGNLMLDAWERQIPDVPPPLTRDARPLRATPNVVLTANEFPKQ